MTVAITGLGITSAAGAGAQALCEAVNADRSCLAALSEELCAGLPIRFGGRIDVTGDRAIGLARGALEELFAGAAPDRARTGLTLGSGLGAMERSEAATRRSEGVTTRSEGALSGDGAMPLRDLHPHALTVELAEALGLRGPRGTHTVTCVSALYAIEEACCALELGRASAMVCGGVETLSRTILGGFCALDALSTSAGPGKPPAQDGIVLGEGACFLLLEPEAAAGTRARARITGRALVTEGTHMTSPNTEGAGMEAAVSRALGEAGLAAPDVGRVTLTAPASPAYAMLYDNALGRVLGDDWRERACTWEASVGHVLGASGSLGIAFATLVLEGRLGPAPDSPHVLALTVGFGGQSGATVVSR